MTERETLVRNTFWYGAVTLVGLASGILMSVILARGLGPARMGEFSYVLWAARTLTALASLGFAVGTLRYTASARARGNPALAWGCVEFLRRRQLLATAIVAALATPVILATAPPSSRWPLVVICLALFPVTIEQIYSNAVYGADRYDLTAQTSTVKMLLHFVAAVVALAFGLDILGIVVGNLIGTTMSGMLQRYRARAIYPVHAAEAPSEALRRDMRSYLVPLAVVVMLDALVWDRSEIFFLRLWGSPHDIAFYSLAFGLATKAMILPEISVGALLTTFSALHGRGAMDEFRLVYRAALRNVALLGVPIAAVTTAIAPALVQFLYGEQYLPVAALLAVMMVVSVFGALRKVGWAALRGLGDRRCGVIATGFAAAVNVGAAVLLIGPWGTWGAVAANTLAQLVATGWAFAVMARLHGCRVPVLDLARVGSAGLIAFGVTLAIAPAQPDVLRLVVATGAGLTAYTTTAVALRIVGAAEWASILNILRRIVGRAPGSTTPRAPTAAATKAS